jgi:hypothetical protein
MCDRRNFPIFMLFPSVLKHTELYGGGHTKETGNRRETAISENCYQTELNTWNCMEQRKLRKRQRNSQATEQASLLTVALPRSFLVSAVLTCFCDSFASLDGTRD